MVNSQLQMLDWLLVISYIGILFLTGYKLSQKSVKNNKDFFLAKGSQTPTWVATLSVVATAMSGATFLGAPNISYGGNWTYLTSFLGLFVSAILVAKIIIPKLYQQNATTVYELLGNAYGPTAKNASGIMYLIGRFLASGSRLYMAGLAVSMILFNSIDFTLVAASTALISILGLAYTWVGGIRSVMWGDVVQLVIFVSAAIIVIVTLLIAIPGDLNSIAMALTQDQNGNPIDKLKIFQFDWSFTPWSISLVFSGWILFGIASWGLDQDMTQRMLACKNAREGALSAWSSVIIQIPIVIIFLFIGSLLYIYYQRPDIMGSLVAQMGDTTFNAAESDKIKLTTIMYYALNELGAGFKGLIAIGVVAAAFSTVNSGLNSMSSVMVEDLYRPLAKGKDELHFVKAGRWAMLLTAIVLTFVGMLCYYWQRYTDTPLLNFALGVMGYAYGGLLGVYAAAIFTKRGSSSTVVIALIAGFILMLWSQFFWPQAMPIAKINPFMMLIPISIICFLITILGNKRASN